MDICFELDRERDVAYIRLHTHDPLKRVWKSLVDEACVLDFDTTGDLVGLQLPPVRLSEWGIRLP